MENSSLATIVPSNCEGRESCGLLRAVCLWKSLLSGGAWRSSLEQREQVSTSRASSLTAKPTGAQQMCNVLFWVDRIPIHQPTRLHHARP